MQTICNHARIRPQRAKQDLPQRALAQVCERVPTVGSWCGEVRREPGLRWAKEDSTLQQNVPEGG